MVIMTGHKKYLYISAFTDFHRLPSFFLIISPLGNCLTQNFSSSSRGIAVFISNNALWSGCGK
jgi:hypothetical protein